MIFVVENKKELEEKIWQEIKDHLPDGIVIGLRGDLGAGKTTLVQLLALRIGITQKVNSPTFNLRKRYDLPKMENGIKCLQHIDLYRISSPTHLDKSEVKEWLSQKDCVTFVEWPENLPQVKEQLDCQITIRPQGKTKREVEIEWL